MREVHLSFKPGMLDIDEVRAYNAALDVCERLSRLPGLKSIVLKPLAEFEMPADIYDKLSAASKDPKALMMITEWVSKYLCLEKTPLTVALNFTDEGIDGMDCRLVLMRRHPLPKKQYKEQK